MMNRTVKQFFFLFILFSISWVLCNCRDPFQNSGSPEKQPSAERGIVQITLAGLQDDIFPRTIFPNVPVLSSYRLSFTPLGGQEPRDDMISSANATGEIRDIDLEVGRWSITVYGRVDFEGNDKEIAEGSGQFDVRANENIDVTITIRLLSVNAGNGLFTWKLNLQELILNGVEAGSWSMTLSEWDNETNRIIEILNETIGSGTELFEGSQHCASGYYLLQISLGTDRQRVFYTEAVHIRAYETTSYTHDVKPDEFVPVLRLSGSVEVVSFRFNGILTPGLVTPTEVWAYSSNGEKRMGYAKINGRDWEMWIAQPDNQTDLAFRVIIPLDPLGSEFQSWQVDVETTVTRQVHLIDISGIDITISPALLSLNGNLNAHTANNIPMSDWEVRAYTASHVNDDFTLAINASTVKTKADGSWSMVINAFNTPTDVYFCVEKMYGEAGKEKKYKRINLGKQSVSDSHISKSIPLTAYFTPPKQVWLHGNIIANEASAEMIPFTDTSQTQRNNERFTYTRNNIHGEQNPCSFTMLAYFDNEVSTPNWDSLSETAVAYNFSNVISPGIGLSYYNDSGTISWNNSESPNNSLDGRDNVRITLDFTNLEYFDETARPVLKIEKCSELLIPAAVGHDFQMGSPTTENGRWGPNGLTGASVAKPAEAERQHYVALSSFYMMPTTVTQEMYEELTGALNWTGKDAQFRNNAYPVVYISWYDAVEFANKLSEAHGLTRVYTIIGSGSSRSVAANWNASGWRLPTEAEWEYACRAGTTTPFAFGDTLNTGIANYNGSAVDTPDFGYNPVPGINRGHIIEADYSYYEPNAWGLKQMHGNVWEMCWDWYGTYPTADQTNPRESSSLMPTGPNGLNKDDARDASRDSRIIRGGSYYCSARFLRSAHRGVIKPTDNTYNDIGFRLVRKR